MFSELMLEMQGAVDTIMEASQEEIRSLASTLQLQLDVEGQHRINTTLKAEVKQLEAEEACESSMKQHEDSSGDNLHAEVSKLEERLDMLRRPSSVMFPQLLSSRKETLQSLKKEVECLRLELGPDTSKQSKKMPRTSGSRSVSIAPDASKSRAHPLRRERPVNDWFSDEGISFGIFSPAGSSSS